eukprot:SAG31_NODE_138_length_22877_cov_29.540917_22_plen_195_part_00
MSWYSYVPIVLNWEPRLPRIGTAQLYSIGKFSTYYLNLVAAKWPSAAGGSADRRYMYTVRRPDSSPRPAGGGRAFSSSYRGQRELKLTVPHAALSGSAPPTCCDGAGSWPGRSSLRSAVYGWRRLARRLLRMLRRSSYLPARNPPPLLLNTAKLARSWARQDKPVHADLHGINPAARSLLSYVSLSRVPVARSD